jgi:hypothetical protein
MINVTDAVRKSANVPITYSIKMVRLSDLQVLMWICTRVLKQVEKQGPQLKDRFKNSQISVHSTVSDCGLLSNLVRYEVS